MKLSKPEESLAGCVWLPRLMDRARAINSGSLPKEYAARFCAPDSVDSLFLHHFALTRNQILKAAELDDSEIAKWFRAQPGSTEEQVHAWNNTAMNLGRPGFPMAERLPIALRGKYKHVAKSNPQTIFEMLNADEKAS